MHPTQQPEGIRVTLRAEGLTAAVTRHDTTHIAVAETGFTEAVAALAGRGDFLLIDGGLYTAWEHRLRPLLAPGRHLVVEPGESAKTLENATRIITVLHEAGVDRQTTVTAVGGGVLCDLTGLVANLYFRGVRAAYVPTTLLAMIDAAIGGKTGVNHPRQKNLIGTFSHPAEVHIHLDTLTTLPRTQLVSAYGEALKIAIVDDPKLFDLLAGPLGDTPLTPVLKTIVERCAARKLELLGANAFERNLERALNLGHTVAHPLEDITGFRIPHGTAVGIGIAVASHISHARGRLTAEDFQKILAVMDHLGLPLMDHDFGEQQLLARVRDLTLQRGGHSLHYVLPTAIGKVIFTDTVTDDELLTAVTELRARAGGAR
ncbi:3-dehydroquinate synthase [Streptomyces sp. ISL-43]|uniref:3-dehydroquinate synthase family protein n=1 Tax=Streptomyces sp. ISL-43 TaxID=2819183 RepID=UPI001BEB0280|nr:3-dehydroquinate synthase family protein [Streptomyces sp. ISL-43]MBT2452482.1 3-dehydroquinate synthase [Streptomyces sp. ISL-43]